MPDVVFEEADEVVAGLVQDAAETVHLVVFELAFDHGSLIEVSLHHLTTNTCDDTIRVNLTIVLIHCSLIRAARDTIDLETLVKL